MRYTIIFYYDGDIRLDSKDYGNIESIFKGARGTVVEVIADTYTEALAKAELLNRTAIHLKKLQRCILVRL